MLKVPPCKFYCTVGNAGQLWSKWTTISISGTTVLAVMICVAAWWLSDSELPGNLAGDWIRLAGCLPGLLACWFASSS